MLQQLFGLSGKIIEHLGGDLYTKGIYE